MSAFGTKRTWACALHMSAFDPKRTSSLTANDLSSRNILVFNFRANLRVSIEGFS